MNTIFSFKWRRTLQPTHCPHCGCVTNLYKQSNREQLCTDLPVHGKRVGLLIKRQRYKCRRNWRRAIIGPFPP
uniref:transposase family protein n=1 Tax=Paenibacillus woosongensis TaxID=307580 RepID=UPI001FD4FD50|nr:transposase family protein [Paenibacillus woosongensis]